MPKLMVYAERVCSRCDGTGAVLEPGLDEEVYWEDCPQCKATGRALEWVWPPPLEAAECGVEVPPANIHE